MRISLDRLKEGIKKCLVNADSLIEEAKILKENNKNERAYFLFQIAIEEIGKSYQLFDLLMDCESSYVEFSKSDQNNFKNHIVKTKNAILIDLIIIRFLSDKTNLDRLFKSIAKEYQNVEKINNYKNFSLYVSLFIDKFELPKRLITKQILEEIEFRAEIRLWFSSPFLLRSIDKYDEIAVYWKSFKQENDNMSVEDIIKHYSRPINLVFN